MKPVVRRALGILCLVLALYFLLPLVMGVLHIGMIWPAAVLLVLSAILLRPQWFDRIRRHRVFCAVCIGCFRFCLASLAALFLFMGIHALNRPPAQGEITVIVLGCQVSGSEPSLILQNRIEAACDYLKQNPDAVCIASGGMDDDEIMTEAACIRRELIARGIDANRIYTEERSGSTAENLSFSAAVIRDNELPTHVAIASDRFHQMRAAIYADRNGLIAESLGCSSVWYLGPGYWAREVLAIAAALVRGY